MVAPDVDFAICVEVIILQVFASCFAARSCLPKWFIITRIWFELGMYRKISQTGGSFVVHDRSFCEDLSQSARGLK